MIDRIWTKLLKKYKTHTNLILIWLVFCIYFIIGLILRATEISTEIKQGQTGTLQSKTSRKQKWEEKHFYV